MHPVALCRQRGSGRIAGFSLIELDPLDVAVAGPPAEVAPFACRVPVVDEPDIANEILEGLGTACARQIRKPRNAQVLDLRELVQQLLGKPVGELCAAGAVRLTPSGVMSNAHASTTATGKSGSPMPHARLLTRLSPALSHRRIVNRSAIGL